MGLESVEFNDVECILSNVKKSINDTAISISMAVIGSRLGFPSIKDLISLKMVGLVVTLFFVLGIIWLIVDYARMLRLHRKMVRELDAFV